MHIKTTTFYSLHDEEQDDKLVFQTNDFETLIKRATHSHNANNCRFKILVHPDVANRFYVVDLEHHAIISDMPLDIFESYSLIEREIKKINHKRLY